MLGVCPLSLRKLDYVSETREVLDVAQSLREKKPYYIRVSDEERIGVKLGLQTMWLFELCHG